MGDVDADDKKARQQETEYENQIVFEVRAQQPERKHQGQETEACFGRQDVKASMVQMVFASCLSATVDPALKVALQRLPDS